MVLRRLLTPITELGSPACLPVLRRLLDRVGSRTEGPRAAAARARLAAEVHLILARLGSRIALFDLRERLLARPVRESATLLSAAAQVGDATLVPALAALAGDAPSTLPGCAQALDRIAQRERLRPGRRWEKLVRPEHRRALTRLWSRVSAARAG